MKTLFHNARILKMNDTPIFIGDVFVDGNIISEIGTDLLNKHTYDRVIECNQNLIMPSFKDAHAHNGMTFLRSAADDMKLQDWLFTYVFPREEYLSPELIKPFYELGYLELISNGFSACLDFYFYISTNIEVASEFGFRLITQAGVVDNDFDYNTLPQLENDINKDPNSLIKYAIGCHSEYTMLDENLKLLKELRKRVHLPFYTHLSETVLETEECKKRRGKTPLQFFIDEGLYDYGGGVYHGIYLSDEDIALCKKYDISIISCPCSNSKLASGIAPLRKYIEAGLNVCIATDGPASNNSLDMFKEMTVATFNDKILNHDSKSLPTIEFLKMATVNASKALRLPNCTYLDEGQLADIIMIDLSRPNMQPINNIINNLVYSGNPSNIKLTMINGNILYEDGKFNINKDINEIYKQVTINKDKIEELVKGNK